MGDESEPGVGHTVTGQGVGAGENKIKKPTSNVSVILKTNNI